MASFEYELHPIDYSTCESKGFNIVFSDEDGNALVDIVAKNIYDVDILDSNISPGTSINIDGSSFKFWQSHFIGNCQFHLGGGGGITTGWESGYHHLGGSFYCDSGQEIKILGNDINIGDDQWTNFKGYFTLRGNSSITVGSRWNIYYAWVTLDGHLSISGNGYVSFYDTVLSVESGASLDFQGYAYIGFYAGIGTYIA